MGWTTKRRDPDAIAAKNVYTILKAIVLDKKGEPFTITRKQIDVLRGRVFLPHRVSWLAKLVAYAPDYGLVLVDFGGEDVDDWRIGVMPLPDPAWPALDLQSYLK